MGSIKKNRLAYGINLINFSEAEAAKDTERNRKIYRKLIELQKGRYKKSFFAISLNPENDQQDLLVYSLPLGQEYNIEKIIELNNSDTILNKDEIKKETNNFIISNNAALVNVGVLRYNSTDKTQYRYINTSNPADIAKENEFLKNFNSLLQIEKTKRQFKKINLQITSTLNSKNVLSIQDVIRLEKHNKTQSGADFKIITSNNTEILFSYKHQDLKKDDLSKIIARSMPERYKGFVRKLKKIEQKNGFWQRYDDFVNYILNIKRNDEKNGIFNKDYNYYMPCLIKGKEKEEEFNQQIEEFKKFLYEDSEGKEYAFILFSSTQPELEFISKNSSSQKTDEETFSLNPSENGQVFINPEIPGFSESIKDFDNYIPYLMSRKGPGGTEGLRFFIAPKLRAVNMLNAKELKLSDFSNPIKKVENSSLPDPKIIIEENNKMLFEIYNSLLSVNFY